MTTVATTIDMAEVLLVGFAEVVETRFSMWGFHEPVFRALAAAGEEVHTLCAR